MRKQNRGEGISAINKFFWALIGLMLTVVGTFVEVFVVLPEGGNMKVASLGITYQLAGVFFTGMLAGKNAAAAAQIAYVIMGLFKLPIFFLGGSFDYLQYPSFGYILGFIPGAWLCGFLAIPGKRRLELFALSAFCGLLVVHACGILYLVGYTCVTPLLGNQLSDSYLWDAIRLYTITPFASQLALICAVSLVAFVIRLILLY
ncbi:MAG: biotin transporter BioY [Geminocystis sp.]|nr:biotin transporter BioY [Geminocystis sp.]MCS7148664.1 biotin transporter BioY [Geminocystis sp.]MCX8078194.1 biotin transporter BioY [Geminocystis sp.]MDW8464344.1 biotin transporter BioY [Geminocystis sp.]